MTTQTLRTSDTSPSVYGKVTKFVVLYVLGDIHTAAKVELASIYTRRRSVHQLRHHTRFVSSTEQEAHKLGKSKCSNQIVEQEYA